MGMPSFMTDLRRHQVFRVAMTYAVTAWLMLPILDRLGDTRGGDAIAAAHYAFEPEELSTALTVMIVIN